MTAPVLFALKEFPELSKLIQRKFKTATDRNQVIVFPFIVLRMDLYYLLQPCAGSFAVVLYGSFSVNDFSISDPTSIAMHVLK